MLEYLKNYYKEHNYPIKAFNLIGIRNEKGMKDDVINDRLGFFTDTEYFLCTGTTDPSVYWTTSKERNAAGTFHLIEGYHDSIWTFGNHKGYPALVNDYRKCKPTKGWRDVNYNFTRDSKDIIVCDYYGVNFHRMHETILMKLIGKYSAGCQVVRDINDFKTIYQKAKASGVEVFSYNLFLESEVKDILKAA